jgi:hypothetical protein
MRTPIHAKRKGQLLSQVLVAMRKVAAKME